MKYIEPKGGRNTLINCRDYMELAGLNRYNVGTDLVGCNYFSNLFQIYWIHDYNGIGAVGAQKVRLYNLLAGAWYKHSMFTGVYVNNIFDAAVCKGIQESYSL